MKSESVAYIVKIHTEHGSYEAYEYQGEKLTLSELREDARDYERRINVYAHLGKRWRFDFAITSGGRFTNGMTSKTQRAI